MNIEPSIRSFSELKEVHGILLPQIKKIFFDTTTRIIFSGAQDREQFFKDWTSYYFENHPLEFLILFHLIDNKPVVLGYLSGCSNSALAEPQLSQDIKSFPVFKDLFKEYPAHFHINLDTKAQGQGLGSQLLSCYLDLLKESHIPGVHIMTAADARNVSFYFRNGFTDQWEREFMGSRLKFMGKKL